MIFPNERSLVFELRCRTRREVAEVLSLIPAGPRPSESARRLRERYLAAVHSADALRGVSEAAHDLAREVRQGR